MIDFLFGYIFLGICIWAIVYLCEIRGSAQHMREFNTVFTALQIVALWPLVLALAVFSP